MLTVSGIIIVIIIRQSTTVVLKPFCASESLWEFVKTDYWVPPLKFLIQQV